MKSDDSVAESETKPKIIRQRGSSFKGDVFRLASGTGVAQIITILAMPVLTRLFAPEAFGVAALFASIAATFGVLACLRYELAIVLPESDREAANLLGISFCVSFFMSLLVLPIVWLFGGPVLEWAGLDKIIPYIWLIPAAIFIQGIFISLNYWNTRTKHFSRLSLAKVNNQTSATLINLGAGFAGYVSGGVMIIASIIGQLFSAGILAVQTWRDNGRFILKNLSLPEMAQGLKKYKKFPKYSSWSSLLNTASWQLPILMLGVFFSPIVVGFYALGFRILQMPMSLIASAIGQVFVQRAAEVRIQGNLAPLVESLFQRLVIFSLVPMLVLALCGKELYLIVFGQDWVEAGFYTQILAPWAFVWFISSPLGNLTNIIEKQEFNLKVNLLLLLTRVLSFAVGGYLGSVILSLVLFSITGLLVYGWFVFKIISFSGVDTEGIFRFLTKRLLNALLYLIPVIIAKVFVWEQPYVLIAVAILMVLLYVKNNLLSLVSEELKWPSKRNS